MYSSSDPDLDNQSFLIDELSELILQEDDYSPSPSVAHTASHSLVPHHKQHHRPQDASSSRPAVELRIPTNYKAIVSRIERRFKSSATESANCLINLQDLKVVGATLPGDRQQTHYPVLANGSDSSSESSISSCSSDSDSLYEDCESDIDEPVFTMKPPSTGSHHKNQALAPYRPSAYLSGGVMPSSGSLARYEAPSSSLIFDMEYQMTMLVQMRKTLRESEAVELRRSLERKILTTLGLPGIPSPDSLSIQPFITFDDAGDYHVTFVYDSPPFTFWPSFLKTNFSPEYLMLQKEVYSLIGYIPPIARRSSGIMTNRPSISGMNALLSEKPAMDFGGYSDDGEDMEDMEQQLEHQFLPPMRRSTPLPTFQTPDPIIINTDSGPKSSGKGMIKPLKRLQKTPASTSASKTKAKAEPKKRASSFPVSVPSKKSAAAKKETENKGPRKTKIGVVADPDIVTPQKPGRKVDQILAKKTRKSGPMFSTPIVSKSAAAESPAPDEALAVVPYVAPQPVKRGPGRPRKHPLVSPAEPIATSTPKVTPKTNPKAKPKVAAVSPILAVRKSPRLRR